MRKKVTKIATSCSLKSNTMINKRAKKAVKPPRKTRSKTKKPKYLSLRLQLSSEKTQQHLPTQEIFETEVPTSAVTTNNEHRQLNLFPLHPENDSTHEDHNMANYFFSSADGGATTLTGLLDSSTTSTSDVENATATLSSSVSLNCTAYEDSEELLRTALRRRNEVSEERWVCYSEVVERRLDEEVTSCAVLDDETKPQKLDLKLDYEKIMNAWSDRGSLYIERDHTVPDINDDHLHLPHETLLNGLQDCPGSSMGLWNVPEIKNSEGQVSDEMKQAQRKASVLRYKEKRQNRLFAKRIRYEVRKLNAEKRPRVKGRFVKRS